MINKADLKDIVRCYLEDDIALYSLWMPGDVTTSAIAFTDTKSFQTFDCIIEKDDVFLICVKYLISVGAPVFKTTKLQTAYTVKLENQLRHGLSPAEARAVALAKTQPPESMQITAAS